MRAPTGLPFNGELPDFQDGVNVTVRLGKLWLAAWLHNGEQPFPVHVIDGDGEAVCEAQIVDVYYCRIRDIPVEWLERGGLDHQWLTKMSDAYANAREPHRREAISTDDYVSVVFFTI